MRRALSFLTVVGLATAAVAWQRSVNQLQQDGKTISTNLRVVDGSLMVPVKDVAAYLGGDLKVENGTATISTTRNPDLPSGAPAQPLPAGALGSFSGTTQPVFAEPKPVKPKEIAGTKGQDANVDGFAFRVVSVEEIAKGGYQTQLDPRHRKVSPVLSDDRLVVVRMRLENVSTETRRPALPGGGDLSLFDEKGVGVPVLAFDARPIGNADLAFESDNSVFDTIDAPLLAPKGAFEFSAVFGLPKSSVVKRLVIGLPASTSDSGGANVTVGLVP